jgi:carboxyl-terminal processing protease
MLTGKTWPEAADMLKKRYERVLKRVDQVATEDVFEGLMNCYARNFDPHSSYFAPKESEEYKITMSLNYEGIGASLLQDDDYVKIANVIDGGPAAVAGTLKADDRVVAVGQGKEGPFTDVIGWRLDDVVQLIRGKAGTTVRLSVLPPGAAPGTEKVVQLVRGKVQLENQAAKKEVKTITRNGKTLKVGIITVPGFYEDTDAQAAGDPDYRSLTHDVRKLVKELKAENIDGLVLDLRDNGGGFLPEAQGLTGLFIDQGPVVQLREGNGHCRTLRPALPTTARWRCS